jgi:phosphate starvation-inducible PhoH-like protein
MRTKKNNDINSFDIKNIAPYYKSKTNNQETYFKYLNDEKLPIVISIGPAGSGKTLLACNQAVTSLRKGIIQKIVLTRPIVTVEEDIGYLPGNLINKMDPWTRPIFDILLEFYSQKDIDLMLHNGVIEISPLAFMRGRTFKNAFIIADEMQNSSPNQMLMLSTRIGDGSRLIITGDLQQSDRCVDNGLLHFITKMKAYNNYCSNMNIPYPNIGFIEMNNNDIQRNPIISTLLDIFSFEEKENNKNNNNINKNNIIDNDKKNEVDKDMDKNVDNEIVKKDETNKNNINNEINNMINEVDDITDETSDKNNDLKNLNDAALIPLYHMNRYMNIDPNDLTSYYY